MQNVLDYLLADRTATLSAADISERFGHDASPGTPLHMALAANDKIEVLPDGSFAYKVSSFPPCATPALKAIGNQPPLSLACWILEEHPCSMSSAKLYWSGLFACFSPRP